MSLKKLNHHINSYKPIFDIKIMIKGFSDSAKMVLGSINAQALRFNHEYIEPEHILLSMLNPSEDFGIRFFDQYPLKKITIELENSMRGGPDMVTQMKLPLTPRSKRSLGYAVGYSEFLELDQICPEQILCGIVKEKENLGAQVLRKFGLDESIIDREYESLRAKLKFNSLLKNLRFNTGSIYDII